MPGRVRRSSEEHAGGFEELGVDGLELADRVVDRDPLDALTAERDHGAEVAVVHRVDGGDAEAGGEDAVVRGGRAAAQDVAEDGDAGLEAGATLDLLLHDVADA